MEAPVHKSDPPHAEETETPSFTLKSRATYTVQEDIHSPFNIKSQDSFRNHSNSSLSSLSFLMLYNNTSFPLNCNDCELNQVFLVAVTTKSWCITTHGVALRAMERAVLEGHGQDIFSCVSPIEKLWFRAGHSQAKKKVRDLPSEVTDPF